MTERADWTLLIPLQHGPIAEVVVDGPPELGELLVENGLAESWCSFDDPGPRAQLVVSRSGGDRDIVDLARRVAPDGHLYVEAPRRGLDRTRKRLRSAGLTIRSVHGIAPDISSPRRYVPLDDPSALAWYIRGLVVPSGPVERLAQTASLAGLRLSDRWAPATVSTRFAHVAIVAAAGDVPAPARREVVLTSGHDLGSRSVVVAFDRSDRRPSSITKVAMRREAADATRREGIRMDRLRHSLPYTLASAIPRPIGERSLLHGVAAVETCAGGASLAVTSARWGRPLRAKVGDLRAAVDWLVAFGNTTAVMGGIDPPEWTAVFREASELLEPSPAVRSMLLDASDHVAVTPRCHRSVHVHGDPGPWNVYVSGRAIRRVGVIDWEHDGSRPPLGPPLADVIYLATYWYFAVAGITGRSDEERALVDIFGSAPPSDRAIGAVRRVLTRAAVRSGLGRSDVLPLAIALWAGQAIDVRRRQERLGIDVGSDSNRVEGYLSALASIEKETEHP